MLNVFFLNRNSIEFVFLALVRESDTYRTKNNTHGCKYFSGSQLLEFEKKILMRRISLYNPFRRLVKTLGGVGNFNFRKNRQSGTTVRRSVPVIPAFSHNFGKFAMWYVHLRRIKTSYSVINSLTPEKLREVSAFLTVWRERIFRYGNKK